MLSPADGRDSIATEGSQMVLGRLHYIANHAGADDPGNVLAIVSLVLDAGVRCVQVRSKECSDRQRYELARRAVQISHGAGATCIINDRVDIALATGADGAHVGEEDLPVTVARRLLGPDLVLGASVVTPEQAMEAEAAGADYLGAGPCYFTATKESTQSPIGPQALAAITRVVGLPVIAIGGVTAQLVPELLGAGAYGVAVISAIAMADDPASAATEFVSALGAVPMPTRGEVVR
jgi:thiamine-phosphate pyrophosphorylase